MRTIFAIAATIACSIAVTGCTQKNEQTNLDFTAAAKADDIGKTAYLVNYDTKEKVDSSIIEADTLIHIKTNIKEPAIARLFVGDQRRGVFIIEPGTLTLDEQGNISGSELNNQLQDFEKQLSPLYETVDNDSISQDRRNLAKSRINSLMDSIIATQNIIGFSQLSDYCYYMDAEQFDSLLTKYPYYKDFENVKRMSEAKKAASNTGIGKKFVDFTIGEGDTATKLSDFVGKGRYTLVDFWASWCGPCRREMKNIKNIYADYNKKGLDVIGVAVWDKKADTEKAVAQLELPWPQILDAKEIPTNIYGIIGIPHLILFDPQGVVVARNIAGKELRSVVDSVMASNIHHKPATTAIAPDSTTSNTPVSK
ncbi:TlpA disulfide reductase family protein [uncultured Muribaculum sp.]|uniref:TlpA disulfide reductase family protein n=1 Tax=uncultured Muribaculum sp. TaxID=1918613 RepID=UPI0025AFF47B|nr:TlpA disulfide reductase family protein [uncultured Muribaculum sp.]